MKNNRTYVWIDLEMTGLKPEKDTILEIATIITDTNLQIQEIGPSFVIYHPTIILDTMDEWCIAQHGASGLTQAVKESKTSMRQAEEKTLAFIKKHCKKYGGVLCGNSVWQDKLFLRRYMPKIVEYLHYRLVDVSSIKDLIKNWYPNNPHASFKKKEGHRALDDIIESIEELKIYKKYFFIPE